MSSFTKALIVSPLADGKTWVTLREFSYYTELFSHIDTIEVEPGFTTDFTSVPRLLWAFFPRWGKYGNAAVVHDWLYWQQPCSRTESDAILLEGMKVLGTGGIQRYTIYYCVRALGWVSWWRNQKDKKANFNRVIRIDSAEVKSTHVSQRAGLIKQLWQGVTR